ncbi:MAG: hypothetical protein ACXVIY_10575, partial [Mucilaginibacter sp.]
MKKILLQYALLMLPVFAFAQNDAPLYKDFRIKTKGIEYCFKLNDHANAMQINLGDNNYELVAIDDKMQVAWSVMLKGLAYTGKFQEHILAIAASYKGGISTFTGLLIDEKTGKILLQKVIYEYKPETTEYPHTSFSNDGAFFTLILRHTVLSKSFSPFSSDEGETKSITSINFNGQLESKISKLKVPDGTYLNMTSNDQGDLYIFTYQKEKTITVYRYGAGKIEPSAPVILDIGLRHEDDVKHGRGEVTPSSADRNVVYFAAVHRNADNDNQLTVCKLDFKDN